jgi:D-glycero-D-manno-heptose 1,7-bisphosphate phosphatase
METTLRRERAIFFDRDGVLTKLVNRGTEYTSAWRAEEFELYPLIHEALALTRPFYKHFVVTNQPGISDGVLAVEVLEHFHQVLSQEFGFDDIVYCSDRRSPNYKPNPGAVLTLIHKYHIDPQQSFMVGDRWKDIVCGQRAGLTTIFVGSKYDDGGTNLYPSYSVANVYEACQVIANHPSQS